MRFALTRLEGGGHELIEANESVGIGEFVCPECLGSVVFCRASANGRRAYFRHKDSAVQCSFGAKVAESIDAFTCEATALGETSSAYSMGPWHATWQDLATSDCRKEARGIGGDARPRDLADCDGNIVEIQHSPITKDEFLERNASAPNLMVWIFDATEKKIWNYGNCTTKRGESVCFCEDSFRCEFLSLIHI
mgnify:FL=1